MKMGFVDTYRIFKPMETGFTHFANNINLGHLPDRGSRIDYLLVSEELKNNVKESVIHSDIKKFHHCPISITLEF